jgi:alkanesulfonate monooxygenase
MQQSDAPLSISWFLPTNRDGHTLSLKGPAREPEIAYLRQIALAADALGYQAVLVPTGNSCEDPWVVSSLLAPGTEQLKFLIAVRPGTISPTVAARMSATLERATRGRTLINIVTGADPKENAGEGQFLAHAERYRQAQEWVWVFNRLLSGESVSFRGEFVHVEGAQISFPPQQRPQLYFGGSSPAAYELGGKYIDTFLTWGEPPAQVESKIKSVREAATAAGRTIQFGLRVHVVVRKTMGAAWEAATRLIEDLSDAEVEAAQAAISRSESIGQRRMLDLHRGRRDSLEVSPNLWAGIGLVRGGSGTALVGDPETVAERLREYQSLGISTFILSGYPHLEEAYRFAELVFPLLGLPSREPRATKKLREYGEAIVD